MPLDLLSSILYHLFLYIYYIWIIPPDFFLFFFLTIYILNPFFFEPMDGTGCGGGPSSGGLIIRRDGASSPPFPSRWVWASACRSPGACWASPSCRPAARHPRPAGHTHPAARTATAASRCTSRSARADADDRADGRADVYADDRSSPDDERYTDDGDDGWARAVRAVQSDGCPRTCCHCPRLLLLLLLPLPAGQQRSGVGVVAARWSRRLHVPPLR